MTKACLGNKLESFLKSLIMLFVLLNTYFRCSSNGNLTSKITPRCFWEWTWGCVTPFNFLLNMITWACLLRSGLKIFFHWKAQYLISSGHCFKKFFLWNSKFLFWPKVRPLRFRISILVLEYNVLWNGYLWYKVIKSCNNVLLYKTNTYSNTFILDAIATNKLKKKTLDPRPWIKP